MKTEESQDWLSALAKPPSSAGRYDKQEKDELDFLHYYDGGKHALAHIMLRSTTLYS